MLDHIETLATLADVGTMTRAATYLRLTQSSVSKRIAALEREVGRKLIEPQGRGVRLTPDGQRLLERTAPLIASLRAALREESEHEAGRLTIGVSESILASWGPQLLKQVQNIMPELDLDLNAHRSPVAVEHVRSGEYALALCAGISEEAPDLQAHILLEENMVIVPSHLKPLHLKSGDTVSLLTIEKGSATWGCLERRIRRLQKRWKIKVEVEQTLQSFTCIVQMACGGFGHGLVPIGVARAMGVQPKNMIALPAPGLTRPISLVGRGTTLALPLVQRFREALHQSIAAYSEQLS